MPSIVCISDTHLQHNFSIPNGDFLVHAGDLTFSGDIKEVAKAATWLRGLPHKRKVVIAGNHDWLFQKEPTLAQTLMAGLTYLQDEAAEIDGIKFYGSPWQP